MKLKKGLLIFLALASSACTLTVSRDGTRAYGLNLVQAAEGLSALATRPKLNKLRRSPSD